MLINLIHIAYLRMVKSRAFTVGAVISVFGGLIFTMITKYTMNILEATGNTLDDNPYLWQTSIWNIATNIMWLFTMANLLFSVCDYYKYREMVNIEGAIRSRAKLCIAEVLGLFLFALTMAVIPCLTMLLGIPFDQGNLYSVVPATPVGVYIATAIMIALQSLPIMCFAKIFRRKAPALICYGIYIIFKYLIYLFAVELINLPERRIALTGETLSVLANPTNMLCVWALGGIDTSLLLILGAVILYFVFWIILAVLLSKRRYEL